MSSNKRSSQPLLFILLTLGVKPKILEEYGFSRATIYKYNRQVTEIREQLNTILKKA